MAGLGVLRLDNSLPFCGPVQVNWHDKPCQGHRCWPKHGNGRLLCVTLIAAASASGVLHCAQAPVGLRLTIWTMSCCPQGLRKLGELYTANFAKYANGGGFVSAETAAAITAAGPKLE